jgi:peptidoglycan hydrolase-like protein with peptidoglycan-binding domain
MSKRWAIAGIAAALVAAGAFVVASSPSDNDNDNGAQAKNNLPAHTANVTKQTLIDKETHDGSLAYTDTHKIETKLRGTLTGLAAAGSTVRRGQALYRIDNRPVVVLYGSLPGYRALSAGTEGADVKQFEGNLWALGYRGFTVDDEYTSATAAAVQKWQENLGLDKTGAVELGRAVYTAGVVRVDSLSADLDDAVQPGAEMLQVSGLGRAATVELDVADQRLATKGAAVDVTLPDGTKVKGTISSVATKVEKAQDENSQDTTKIDVTISFSAAPTGLDEAAVRVDFVVSERGNVLTVPVDALLALAEGGYGLQVVDGSTTRIVAVETGLFADGRVEISGGGIAAGMKVGVPA